MSQLVVNAILSFSSRKRWLQKNGSPTAAAAPLLDSREDVIFYCCVVDQVKSVRTLAVV